MKNTTTKTEKTPMFRTQTNYHLTSHSLETPEGISETIPDQSYTIREIMERFVINIPEFLLKNPQYNELDEENPEFNELDGLDIIEQHQYIKDKTEKYNNLQKTIKTKNINKQKTPDETQTKEPYDITPKKTENQPLKNAEE